MATPAAVTAVPVQPAAFWSAKRNKKAPTRLMQAMGAPIEDGFNPVAPRVHRALMGRQYGEKTRIMALVINCTSGVDPQGEFGPPKEYRTPMMHDSLGYVDVPRIAELLDLTLANAHTAVRELVDEKQLWRDPEHGWIFPHGNAPRPIISKGEYKEKVVSVQNMPKGFRHWLNDLPPEERAQKEATWKRQDARAKRLKRNAMMAIRDREAQEWAAFYAAVGYDPTRYGETEQAKKPNGRKKDDKAREKLLVKVEVLEEPDFVQKKAEPYSEQNTEPDLNRMETASVQKSVSLFSSSEDLQSKSLETPEPVPEPEADGRDSLTHPVLAPVEEFFGKVSVPVAVAEQFEMLPEEHSAPVALVAEYVQRKIAEKQRNRYPIETPGALLKFVRDGLPAFLRQHSAPFRENNHRPPAAVDTSPPLSPEDIRRYTAILLDMNASEQEKRIAKRCLGYEEAKGASS